MQNPEKLLEKNTNVVLARLEAIKTIVDTNAFKVMVPIKKQIKGASALYDILIDKRILYKNPHDGIFYWDMKVKVTKQLARRIAIEITEKNRRYTAIAMDNVSVTPESDKSTVNKIIKPKVSMSFFWGLFTFTKD
jgi:hypothetical protein